MVGRQGLVMANQPRWRTVASAVAAAISVPPGQWSRVLFEALEGHPDDIFEAKRLLRHHRSVESFLETPPDMPALAEQGWRLQPGVVLGGRYQIEDRLGAGAMGEVYQALDREVSQRVALKVINPAFSPDAASRDRFRRELKLGRQVRDQHVCQLYDVVTVDAPDGQPLLLLTMELLRGETLDALVTRGPLTEVDARQIADDLLAGLSAAHAQGILHGDLKCSNIILKSGESDSSPRAVITDFGLARRLGPSPLESVLLDDSTMIMGTPAYMPPEQMRGLPLTETADLHAFGVVLFRMVTGRLPFDGDSVQQTVALRLHGAAPRPKDYAPGLSPSLDRAILACLEADPGRRPADVTAVRALLKGAAPVRRARIAGALLIAAAVSGLAAVAWNQWPGAAASDPRVATHLKLGEEFLARRGTGDFGQAISEFTQAVTLSPAQVEGWIGLADAYSGAANWGAIDTDEGLRQARDAIRRAVDIAPNDARVQSLLGYITSIDVERWLSAEPYFLRALELNARDEKAQFWYATHLGRLGRQDEAIALLTNVLASSPQSFSIQHQLAMEYFRSGNGSEFLSHASQLVRIQPNLPNSRLTLARALIENGRLEEAAAECQEAEKFGADRSQLLAILSVVQYRRGEFEAARQSRSELEALWTAKPANSNGVAAAFAVAGEADRAVRYLNEGFERGDSLVLAAHVTPWFRRISQDPGFAAFVRRTGLTP